MLSSHDPAILVNIVEEDPVNEHARSEAIERKALESLHHHCPTETRKALGLFAVEVGDALVCGARHDRSILLNRTLGLGVREPVTPEVIADIQRVYAEHGADRYFVHVYPQSLPAPDAMHPLKKVRGWMKFRRGAEPALVRQCDLEVRRVGMGESLDFGRIVADAFGMTDAAAPLLAGLASDPRWHLFVTYDGDTPAGAGSLFVDDGVGFFEWAATNPAFRRRGSQGAIMTARINQALALGCTQMFTETGAAVDGDPQHSYGNIQRFGFVEHELRENWAPVSY